MLTIYTRCTTNPMSAQNDLVRIHDAHTEFVVGCVWSPYEKGILATCSWDPKVNIFHSFSEFDVRLLPRVVLMAVQSEPVPCP